MTAVTILYLNFYEKINIKISNWTVLILFLIFIISLSFIISKLIVRRIEKISHMLASVDDKKPIPEILEKIATQSGDEISQISKAYFTMLRKLVDTLKELENQHKDVKSQNEHLEEMIEQRTHELYQMNTALKQFTEKVMDELEMARRIQEEILPNESTYPKRSEFKVSSRYLAMESIGGDFFDIIRIGKNGYAFLIADVSGHGVPAALITTMAKVSFIDNSAWDREPAEVCSLVNEEICRLIGNMGYYYITAYYGIINLENGVFQYTNAGHHPAILFRSHSKTIERLNSRGSILGVFEDIQYHTASAQLREGDRIILFTDGLIEARSPDLELYGYERLYRYIIDNHKLPPKEFVTGMMEDVNNYCNKLPPEDDRAVLCVDFIARSNDSHLWTV
jgi:serine phosphatase RsbU (regulator of sigma subunit)